MEPHEIRRLLTNAIRQTESLVVERDTDGNPVVGVVYNGIELTLHVVEVRNAD